MRQQQTPLEQPLTQSVGIFSDPSRALVPATRSLTVPERPRVRETIHGKQPWGAEAHDHSHAVILEQATMISVAQYRRVAHDTGVPVPGNARVDLFSAQFLRLL